MAESKISCPKCGGNIVFPNELAGQAIACPHCNETFFLPKPKSVTPWVITAVFALIVVCLGSLLIVQHKRANSEPETRSFTKPNTSAAESLYAQPEATVSESADDQAIEKVCKEFYNGLSSQNNESIYNLLSEPCKKALKAEDIFIDGMTYEFMDVESIQYKNDSLGKCAMATVRRKAQDHSGSQEGLRDLRFVDEADGWKYFDASDLTKKIIDECVKSGFTDQVNSDIQLMRDGNPFVVLDANNTNAFEAIYKSDQGQADVFPWDVEFLVKSNNIDGYNLNLNYSVRNKSETTWSAPLLEFNLKLNGKVVLSGNDLLPDISSGSQLERNISFFLSGEPQQTTKYALDVYYSIGFPQKSIQLAQNVPLEFKVQKTSDLAKLEVVSTQFDQATSEDFQDMLCARINYRVKNISTEPIKELDVKCVWYSLTGEQLDQSSEDVVGYGDVPLGVGQFKTGFIRCGKGYSNSRVPVTVDVYLESGEKRNLVYKGLLIQ
jgi:hypothetical protein